MTAPKSKPSQITGDVHPDDAHGAEIVTNQPAEKSTDKVVGAQPEKRLTAEAVAWDLADTFGANVAKADGNRLTITIAGPNGLVQTFHATVEEGIREF